MSAKRVVAVAAAAFALAYTSPGHARKYHFDFGGNGGGAWYSNSIGGSDLGATSGGALGFKPGWLVGTQLTWHFSPRFGIRANGAYTDDAFQQRMAGGTNTEIFHDINLWDVTGDLMIGLKSPRDTWSGMEVLPYIALGAGEKLVNP